jgi:UDP-N-acetylglucosamine--N-acetylmuramyl-(pentapeptide) pyrophosphoryl-undecaprenol N-acetylglucosamine transferase
MPAVEEKQAMYYPVLMLLNQSGDTKKELCIAFSGGGTGGHIYPGLAVAAALKQEFSLQNTQSGLASLNEKVKIPLRIFWIGSKNSLDKSIVEDAGFEFFSIPAGKLRRNFSLRNVADCFKVAAGFFAARKILKRETPALLFSKGGFVSVPPCAAAASLGIPVITHESDYSPGLATRINARFAARGEGRIITAYQETAQRFSEKFRNKTAVLGNPVRGEFRNADPEKGRAFLGVEKNDKIILALGGSQGAQELNELVLASLPELTKEYVVVHQTGAGWAPPPGKQGPPAERATLQRSEVSEGSPPDSSRYKPYPYIKEELPHVLAAAELVLARSGAGTVWECAVAGKPMILLPLAGSGTRGDQIENARFFEKDGAAMVLPPNKREPPDLLEALQLFTKNREAMCAASAKIGSSDGTSGIVRLLIDTLNRTEG